MVRVLMDRNKNNNENKLDRYWQKNCVNLCLFSSFFFLWKLLSTFLNCFTIVQKLGFHNITVLRRQQRISLRSFAIKLGEFVKTLVDPNLTMFLNSDALLPNVNLSSLQLSHQLNLWQLLDLCFLSTFQWNLEYFLLI